MKHAAAVLILLSCAALAQEKAPRAMTGAATYRVSGVVVNAITGEALAGASVMLTPSMSGRERSANRPLRREPFDNMQVVRSGADGSFTFDHLAPGKYSLSAERHGFPQQGFDQHVQFMSAIVVGPDKVSTGIRFRMEPDASISGTVLDDHNEPVMNAMVMLFRDGMQNGRHGIFRAQEVMSNDLGRYHFAHLKAGKYYVAVSATPWYAENGRYAYGGVAGGGGRIVSSITTYAGPAPSTGNAALDVAYPFTFYPGVTDSAQAEPISLLPGQRESADFTLTAVPSVHIRVRAATDNPQRNIVAMAMREVFGISEPGNVRSLSYGQGVTEVSGLTPGRYILQLRGIAPGRGPQMISQREIEVTGDMEINADDVPSGVNLAGTIHFNGPAPEGEIRLMIRKLGVPSPVLQVNSKGEISSSEPLAPGKYEVFLPMPNYQITQISAKGALLEGQTIDVGGDDVHLAIEAAKASATIEGTALKDDQGLAGAMIVLVPQDMSRPTLYRLDESDSDGSFELRNVAPGTYTLLALENGWDMEWSNAEVIKPFLSSGEKVQVAIDGHYHVDAKVQSVAGASR